MARCKNGLLLTAALSLGIGLGPASAQTCEGFYTIDGATFSNGQDAGKYHCRMYGVTGAYGGWPWSWGEIPGEDACHVSWTCVWDGGGVSGHAHTLFRNANSEFKTLGKPTCPTGQGNPINTATGNKSQIETDYVGSGPFPLQFIRYYNSKIGVRGSMDARWRHYYDRALYPLIALGANVVNAMRPDGKAYAFRLSGGVWMPDADIYDRLVQTAGGWELRTLDDIVETYDASGKLLSLTNRAGLAQTMTYFASGPTVGLLQTVTDSFGRTLNFTYNTTFEGTTRINPVKRLATMTDPAGGVYTYTYDAVSQNDRLFSVTYPDTQVPSRFVRTYHYNETAYSGGIFPNSLTGITDENSARFANFGYTNQPGFGGMTATLSEHAGGAGKITLSTFRTVTNGTELDVTYSIDPGLTLTRVFRNKTNFGQPLNVTIDGPGPGCTSQDIGYFPNDSIQFIRDFNGNRTNYERQNATWPDLETKRIEGLTSAGDPTPATRTITTAWHATYRLPTQVAEPLRITTNAYGDPSDPNPGNRGSLLSRTIQATTDVSGSQGFGATLTGTPRTWTYTYDSNGQVLTVNGPRTDVSDVTTYAYYANNATCIATLPGASTTGCRGQVQTITNAVGHVTTIGEYNAHGQPLLITDPNSLTTTLAYDTRMQLTLRDVGGELTSYTYDNAGQLTRVAMPDSSALEYQYDAAHRLTEIRLKDTTNALIGKTTYTLDLIGNRTQEQIKNPADVVLQARSREYNNLNRLIKDIGGTTPGTQITEYGYDNQGNLTSRNGPLTGDVDKTTYTYDALNRLATLVDPAGVPGGTTTYGYNGLDQLASVQDPRSLTTSYTYDGLNNLTTQASPDTGNTVNTHDAAGNVLTSTDAKSQVTTYTYDALNRVASITYQGGVVHTYQYDQGTNGKGRLTTLIEPNSTTQYAYDTKGRLTSETRTINSVQYVTGYSYDGTGRMTGMTYPGGRTLTYTLDGVGRIQQISTTKASTTQTVLSGAAYRPFGPVQGFTFGNGQTYARGLDLDGRISSYTLATQTIPLCYDAAGRITGLGGTGACSGGNAYGYDTLDRLLSYTGTAANQTFTYDAVGNRATKVVGAASDTYSFSPTSNRLTTITGANPHTYGYDNNGSITGDSVNTFVYDTRGRMTNATSAIGATTYQLNSLGQRIRKTNVQGDTIYHHDAQGRLISESSPAGQIQREYIYLGDTPVAVIQ